MLKHGKTSRGEFAMDQIVRDMPTLNVAKNTVEIVVHISETLDDAQRNNLVVALEQKGAIVSAEFCPLRYHLMLVRYDRDQYSSQDVLSAVSDRKLQARLIGPI
jgi:hypothetical protein